ncbi:MAG: hypothetical protein FWD25_09285 [Clostridia bacterium]|nr:hypothetical protein [Clostridia bacterium]
MKKFLSLLVAVLFIAASTSALAAPDLYPAGDRYPLDTDVSITWWVGEGFRPAEVFATADESPFHVNLQQLTGVNIDWRWVPHEAEQSQALNLMLTENPLPDVIFGGVNLVSDAARYMEEGVFIDLTPYLEEHAPAYWQWLHSNPAYANAFKTDDGKFFGFGFFREDGGWNDSFNGPLVRQDWLDECGLEAPVTISDWTNVLTVFNEKYGATFTAPWPRFRQMGSGMSGAFGAYGSSDLSLYLDGDGKVQMAQAQPEWLNYMLQLNEWWAAGLIDQDLLANQSDTETRAKVLAGSSGLAYSSMGQLSNWRADADQAGEGANWVGLQYPTGDDGTLSMIFGGYGIGSTVCVISGDTDEAKIPVILQMLDYAYTDEGFLFWNYGVQGESWDYDANGEAIYLPIVTEDPDGLNNAIEKYSGTTWNGCGIQATRLLYLKNNPASIEANNLWFYPNEAVSSYWRLPPGITLTADESTENDFIRSSISTLVSETCAKLITGEMTAADWDEYVGQLESLGLARMLEINQAAYERYLAR